MDTSGSVVAPVPDAFLRRPAQRALDAVESAFDRAFAPAVNPWRHLGSLAWLMFWVVALTGVWVYVGFDTRADGAYASVERLTDGTFPAGAIARSLHRYASDAFVVLTLLHLVREWVRGHYAHFRRFAWIAGVVALWLVFASGIGGFWLVWDAIGHYSLVATMEWLDALPVFDGALMRNFVGEGAVGDRLFSLLVFLHIGFPLALLATMWVHVQRLARPATNPPRALAIGTLATLAVLALWQPVTSAAPADLAARPVALALDWFYLGVHAFMDATSPIATWIAVGGATLFLLALPWTKRTPRAPAARVDLANCNGCARCFDDCPYAAVTMRARTDGRALARQAVVVADLCAGCGICAGACPSSTPYRSGDTLRTGIDMPQSPVDRLRAKLEHRLVRLDGVAPGAPKVVVFGCPPEAGGADLSRVEDARTATIDLLCAGQLPPSFVEYALRAGADGVLVSGCRERDCAFRLGNRWTDERLAATRAPRLRASVPATRVRVAWAGRGQERRLHEALASFRADLARAAPETHLRPKRHDNPR